MNHIPSKYAIIATTAKGERTLLFTWTRDAASGIRMAKAEADVNGRTDLTDFRAEPLLAAIPAEAGEGDLVRIYNEWLAAQPRWRDVPDNHDTSAEALLHEEIHDYQRRWLTGFIEIWQANVG